MEVLGGRVSCRFRGLSDLNLFLFNKVRTALNITNYRIFVIFFLWEFFSSTSLFPHRQVRDPGRRSLGRLVSGGTRRRLAASPSGHYRLLTAATTLPEHLLADLATTPTKREGCQGLVLSFHSRFDLWRFFASEDAKNINHLVIDKTLIEEVEEESEEKVKVEEEREEKSEVEELRRRLEEREVELGEREVEVAELRVRVAELEAMGRRVLPFPGLRVDQLLAMEFKGERRRPYPAQVVALLASPAVLGVEEVGEEPVLRFRDAGSLDRTLAELLTPSSRRAVLEGRAVQRAAITPHPDTADYELVVDLEERGLVVTTIQQVEDQVRSLSSQVTRRPIGFALRLASLTSLLRALLASTPVLPHHTLRISRTNLAFYSDHRRRFKGRPCLVERELLCLAEVLGRRGTGSLASLLRMAEVTEVEEDWEGALVAVFEQDGGLERLVRRVGSSRRELAAMAPSTRLRQVAGRYTLRLGVEQVDMRDFFPLDEEVESPGPGQVASRHKVFLARAVREARLVAAYPAMELPLVALAR